MGCPCEIQLFTPSQNEASRIANIAIADVRRLEMRYSRYRSNSLLSEINRVAAEGGSIVVDQETASLLDYATTCYQQSDGLFDITSGILRRAWHFDTNRLPDQSEIDLLLKKTGWHKLNWKTPELSFPTAGMELDFGGIVKEYATDRAAGLCIEAGIHHGVINLGGDVKLIGPRADNTPWRIGLSEPRKTDSFSETLSLKSGAVASSGDYERCMIVDGIRYSHILNPKTGWPVRYLAAVSVVADFCVVAGSASTIAILKENEGPAWLENLGLPHLWIDINGNRGGNLLSSINNTSCL